MTGSDSLLDDPVGASLRGPHAHLARRHGSALAYDPQVATFVAAPTDPAGWADLAALLGPGGLADLFSSPATPPPGWAPVFALEGLQLTGPTTYDGPRGGSRDPGVVDLGAADVADMVELVAATRPGPFWPRTPEMGRCVGVRWEGRLVAMAGERLHPPGWTEVSAVCTTPDARGRGLAARVVREVVRGVLARGEQPFLHVAAGNATALGLYERLGFVPRRPVVFRGYAVPG